jgi:small subunit ribosomal protein S4
MGRYTGPSCKLCRRAREKLLLKGDRCFTAKCAIEKRDYPPGIRSLRPPKISEYGRRLREKQKLRFFYGVSEKQMRIQFEIASKKQGVTGYNLLSLFERRFDNILYRSSLGKSRKEARQLIKHKHFIVNGKRMDVPSYSFKVGDVISIRPKSLPLFKDTIEALKSAVVPEWLYYDAKAQTITVQDEPTRMQIDIPVEEHLIVEYYSK